MVQQPHSKIYLVILLTIISIAFFYNFNIYTKKLKSEELTLSNKAIKGQKIWLENNCCSCHQFYGLGGYLDPDLTNLVKNKNFNYINSILKSGIGTMPKFNFTKSEVEDLVFFFKEINNTGIYPNKNVEIQYNGWVKNNFDK